MITITRLPDKIVFTADTDDELAPIIDAVEVYNSTLYLKALKAYDAHDIDVLLSYKRIGGVHSIFFDQPCFVEYWCEAGETRRTFIEALAQRVERGEV